jgi:hypothetical protein
MYKYRKPTATLIVTNSQVEGETIETKVRRILENKEPIKDSTVMIYTDRKDGVLPEYNIRTDRFELATEAMDKVHASRRAKRDNLINKPDDIKTEISKAEPTPGKLESQSK